jgi:hypothetical protein
VFIKKFHVESIETGGIASVALFKNGCCHGQTDEQKRLAFSALKKQGLDLKK